MERIIKQGDFGSIACNNIMIYANNNANLGRDIRIFSKSNWEIINPKYYRYTDDDSVLEIWYNGKGMLLSGRIRGCVSKTWTSENREDITYEEAMYILDKEERKDLGYNNKDLMSRVIRDGAIAGLDCARDDMVDAMAFCFYEKENKEESPAKKQNNNGGASDWYALPKNANTLQDLIEHRNMNGSVKDIFKACYRLGIKTEDELRDANKMAYYSLREVGRITGRKDYITIAKELMGSQADEEYCNCKKCDREYID